MMTVITGFFHCKNVLTKNVLPSVVMMMLSLLMMMMMTGFQLSVIVFKVARLDFFRGIPPKFEP